MNEMKNILITAHSGCEGTPDNSMESILKGIELGADCVEIDIRMDTDGALWLTHDVTGDYANTVSLETALHTIAESGIAVNCDLKEYRTLYPVLEMADSVGIPRERLIFSGSVDIGLLLKDPEIVRRAQIFLNSEEICRWLVPALPDERPAHTQYITDNAAKVAEFMRELGVEALNAPYRHTTDAMITAMRNEGVELSLWTVNDEEEQVRLMQVDLLNMTTRKAASALRIRREIRG